MPADRDATLEAVRRVLQADPDVAVGYVYGSVARGSATALSDLDVAVVPRHDADRPARGALQRRLLDGVARAVPGLRVDVRLFDELPLAVQGRVLRDAIRLVDRDPPRRVRLEVRTLMAYHDFQAFERAGATDWARAVRERTSDG